MMLCMPFLAFQQKHVMFFGPLLLAFFIIETTFFYLVISDYVNGKSKVVFGNGSITVRLDSKIEVKSVNNIKIASFRLKSDTKVFLIQIESKNGFSGKLYDELNLDYIMIKPNKSYTLFFDKKEKIINNIVCEELRRPTHIDYFTLSDKFHTLREVSI